MNKLLAPKTIVFLTAVFTACLTLVFISASAASQAEDAYYWLDKAGLYAAYGNEDAAINCYQKALELDPDNADAAFGLGLEYAEKGNYDKALRLVNRAVSIKPENHDYLYGRGWVLMLAGKREKSLEDIASAARLGNPDAIRYMNMIAPRSSD
ncbi:MAG: tetratricopeptide repeat protein [Desulfobacterales bacterium]|nr:tetratricopeptide repeat protein [Desulfobacterales bacterium]